MIGWANARVTALVATALLAAPSGESRPRVLILAIDGTAPALTEELMNAGRLPNLKALAEAGTWGLVRAHKPILSPRIWTSVATGKAPEKHGIPGWVVGDGVGPPQLARGSSRRGAALWSILSHAGMEVATINWLATHPPEKVHGVVISEVVTPGARKSLLQLGRASGMDVAMPDDYAIVATWPPEWQERVVAASQSEERLPGVERPGIEALWKIEHNDDLIGRIALAVEKEVHPDLLMVLPQGIDRLSHFAWQGVAPPEAYPPDRVRSDLIRKRWRKQLHDYYAFTDSIVGLFLERYDPRI